MIGSSSTISFISSGTLCALEKPGKVVLSYKGSGGTYLGQESIIRFNHRYERVTSYL
tara:strand:- start:197 stop:367 length:171 start_codon:yes stop_codon:yes gene_type:complete